MNFYSDVPYNVLLYSLISPQKSIFLDKLMFEESVNILEGKVFPLQTWCVPEGG